MFLSIRVVIFDLENIFLFLFKNNVSTYNKEVVAATLSLSSPVPGTSLMVLIFLVSLVLMGGLSIRYVNRGRISRLSLS